MRARKTVALSAEGLERFAREAMSSRTLGCISGSRKYSRDLTSALRFPHTDRPMQARTATVSSFPLWALAAGLILISLVAILPR
jgi:hypothetical protein